MCSHTLNAIIMKNRRMLSPFTTRVYTVNGRKMEQMPEDKLDKNGNKVVVKAKGISAKWIQHILASKMFPMKIVPKLEFQKNKTSTPT